MVGKTLEFAAQCTLPVCHKVHDPQDMNSANSLVKSILITIHNRRPTSS